MRKFYYYSTLILHLFPVFDEAQGISARVMDASTDESIPYDSYKEVLGEYYGNYEIQKLQIIKAANLHNPRRSRNGRTYPE